MKTETFQNILIAVMSALTLAALVFCAANGIGY
jgi:hypothetical protein